MKQYLSILLSLFLTVTSFAQTKVDGSLLKGDVIGGTASDTRRIVVPKDTKANLDAKTRLEANLVYGTDTKKAYIDNGTDLIAVGSGSGGAVNLITDGDAENATSSIFVPYADAAATRPVDGTGGTANVTTAITSTAPLTGAKSFTITKDAVNRQGQGWSIPFTVPLSMQSKVLQIEVDYIVNSGTFVAGSSSTDSDVIWYLYDVTNSTLIEPSSIKLLSNSSTLSDKFRSTFQTSATGTSYRLIAHVASTSAAAYTLKVETSVSPSTYVYGTPITDWQSYTTGCTGTWTTNTTYTCKKRRVGDSYEYMVGVSLAGAPNATTLIVTIPDTIDTTKITSSTIYASAFESSGQANDSGNGHGVKVAYYSTTQVAITTVVGPQAVVAYNAPFTFGSGDQVNVRFSVPIVGLSSSVQMSDSADTRVVAMHAQKSSAQSVANITNTVITTWDASTNYNDSHGAFNATTGTYTFPVSGWYDVYASVDFATNATGYRYAGLSFVGGPFAGDVYGTAIAALSGDSSRPTVSALRYVNAGTTVACFAYQNSGGALSTRASLSGGSIFTVKRVSGPSAIAASEKISASYYMASNASTSNVLPIQYNTKLWDTHGAVTTGASWKFTAPVAGRYKFITLTLASGAGGGWIGIHKNGTIYQRLGYHADLQSNPENASATIELLAGEYFDIRAITPFTALGGALSSGVCQITIEKE